MTAHDRIRLERIACAIAQGVAASGAGKNSKEVARYAVICALEVSNLLTELDMTGTLRDDT